MKITQLDRKSMVVDDLAASEVFKVRRMLNGTLNCVPLSKVSVQQFIEDASNEDATYILVED